MLTTNEMEQQYLDMLKYVTPMKRFGQASEIATAILYMASEASSFMTGQCIILDGGLTAQ
jgi:NAD(P)-dependent dehydrogenase (short-subunit alcohol dehydrogenase family)